ncbi:hypothetical protein F4802DRAFT_597669 [Xylaria palmicola]|nr:hypothetical protein F4802DRAFT_597669 [Xylaria palmicola]
MATPRLRSPTCLSCLRRLTQPAVPSPLSWTQTRAKASKAELEDLQGIPVRLLRDVPTFGRKHAILRVKAGRMRNIFFPKGAAEYMTKQRFAELGLTEAAIGMRDRGFGTQPVLGEETATQTAPDAKNKRKVLTLTAEETRALLTAHLPEVLVFPRIPVSTTPASPPELAQPRSPSLAANAATSIPAPEKPEPTVTPIFGSVARGDILAMIKESLLADPQGSRVALEAESIQFVGLDPVHDGENRIKRLGTFEVIIAPGVGAHGTEIETVSRVVQVVAENS